MTSRRGAPTYMLTGPRVDDLIKLMPAIIRRSKPDARLLHDCPGGALAYSEIRILVHLAIYDHESVGVVADAIGMSRPAVTEAIDRMTAKGMIERWPSDEDRRRVVLRLTPAASGFADRLVERWRQAFTSSLSNLTKLEQDGFFKGMVALSEALTDPGVEDRSTRDEPVMVSTDSRH